jgi:hypothetical protein
VATWLEDVTRALQNLGGIASLSAIYGEVRRIRPQPHPVSLQAIIRREIENASSDSAVFRGRTDLFYSVEGLGGGILGPTGGPAANPGRRGFRRIHWQPGAWASSAADLSGPS